tara:strand:- start:1391 stop:1600 length:210 start_codon:yes stop_codon:yes gene_type:complete
MNIKLKNKEKPISLKSGWCFNNSGFDSGLIEKINSGKQVKVDKIPKPALDYVQVIKQELKKKTKTQGGK